jgi:mitogen-activated protein kinase kinase kinase 7
MPPEAIGALTYSEKSDVWSFACVLYEIIERKEPFDGMDLFTVAQDIRDNGTSPLRNMTANAPGYITELMGMCFQTKPELRPSFKEVVAFLKGAAKPSGWVNSTAPVRPKYQDMGASSGSADNLKDT